MPHVPKLGIGRLDNPTHYYSSAWRILWNSNKQRVEQWRQREEAGSDRAWVLDEVYPGRQWRDRFVAGSVFVVALLGLTSELPWHVNGRRAAVNAPDDNCFTPANELGGGLSVNVIAGGQANDYTAIHWGGNYPVLLRTSPHFHLVVSLEQITTVGFINGLVDNTRSTGTNAFALPDNGVFLYRDTDIDTAGRLIIRSNGVSVTSTVVAADAIAGAHQNIYIVVDDDGEQVKVVMNGNIAIDWVDISGAAYADLRAAHLQPYQAIINRDSNILRQSHMHDFRLIMDRGM